MTDLEFKKLMLKDCEQRLLESKVLPINFKFRYDLEIYYDNQIHRLKTKINQIEQKINKL